MSSPEPAPRARRSEMTTEQVQRWVVSLLVFAITSFPIGGLIAVSHAVLDQDRRGAAICLMIMAGVIGMLSIGVMRIIHKRSLATPLMLLGLVPAAIASYFIF